jgi:hypothetical protein
MDDMIAGIGMKYDLRSGYQHPPSEVPNFFKLLAASVEKVHDGNDLTYCKLWHIWWCWNWSITSWISATTISWSWLLIPSQWSTICRKTCTSQRRLLPVLVWTMRRLMCAKRTACYSRRSTRAIPNLCIAVGPDTSKWQMKMEPLLPQKW